MLDAAALALLRRIGLLGEHEPAPPTTPLPGGVSSDIVRVDLVGRPPVVLKRARAQLAVAAHWEAPVERSHFEAAWLREVGPLAPGHIPELVGEDEASHTLVLGYLDPAQYRLWKTDLLAGEVDAQVAEMVGRILATVHANTAADPTVAERFDTFELFDALRLEPYLDATAAAHPDLARPFAVLRADYVQHRRVLVHGDVSPKNILVGPIGPVLLDAECATFGDPAFDLAFCCTHLLLKCAYRPASADAYLDGVARVAAAYLTGVTWEPPSAVEARVAALTPALALARIDGKSPVDYLDDRARSAVRAAAVPLVARPPRRLAELAAAWRPRWR